MTQRINTFQVLAKHTILVTKINSIMGCCFFSSYLFTISLFAVKLTVLGNNPFLLLLETSFWEPSTRPKVWSSTLWWSPMTLPKSPLQITTCTSIQTSPSVGFFSCCHRFYVVGFNGRHCCPGASVMGLLFNVVSPVIVPIYQPLFN